MVPGALRPWSLIDVLGKAHYFNKWPPRLSLTATHKSISGSTGRSLKCTGRNRLPLPLPRIS